MQLTRRQFASVLGLTALGGVAGRSWAGESVTDTIEHLQGKPPKSPAPPAHRLLHKAPAAHPAAAHHTAGTPEEVWRDLLAGNRRFMAGKGHPLASIARRKELTEGQHPCAIVLTCSDSRVPPELIFDKGLGELFVVRTAGNVVDPIAIGSMEYALEHLHAKLIVVMGHESCGAVAAAASGAQMPTANLDAVVGQIAPVLDKLKACASGEQLLRLGMEANARHSASLLTEQSPLIRDEIEGKKARIITAAYRLTTGEVVALT